MPPACPARSPQSRPDRRPEPHRPCDLAARSADDARESEPSDRRGRGAARAADREGNPVVAPAARDEAQILGCLGLIASSGAVLIAAGELCEQVGAVVSWGRGEDLRAMPLEAITAPVLLIVDAHAEDLDHGFAVRKRLNCPTDLVVVPGGDVCLRALRPGPAGHEADHRVVYATPVRAGVRNACSRARPGRMTGGSPLAVDELAQASGPRPR